MQKKTKIARSKRTSTHGAIYVHIVQQKELYARKAKRYYVSKPAGQAKEGSRIEGTLDHDSEHF